MNTKFCEDNSGRFSRRAGETTTYVFTDLLKAGPDSETDVDEYLSYVILV